MGVLCSLTVGRDEIDQRRLKRIVGNFITSRVRKALHTQSVRQYVNGPGAWLRKKVSQLLYFSVIVLLDCEIISYVYPVSVVCKT